ncbi:CPBP family intramembrane glutamic endopeptidase [Pseudonocardia sp. DLS-67]
MVDTSRRDLLLFFVGTFAGSWLLWGAALLAGGDVAQPLPQLLFVIGTFGPTAVALLLWCCGRRRPRGDNPFRTVGRWLPAALLLGAAPTVAGALVDGTLDPAVASARAATVGGPLAVVGYVLVAGPLAEEFGWRGYAQPRLRRLLAPVPTAVLLGLAWAVWHVPLFLVTGTTQSEIGLFSVQALLFFATFVPLSYTIWVVSERLRGGVAAAVAVHAAYNGASGLFPSTSTSAELVTLAVATAIAVALHLLVGRTTFDRREHPAGACSMAG